MSAITDALRAFAASPEREAAIAAVKNLEDLDARIAQARALGAPVDQYLGAFRLLVVDEALGGLTVAQVEAASRVKAAKR